MVLVARIPRYYFGMGISLKRGVIHGTFDMAGPASLRRFHLEGVRDTGRVIGEGAYAVVKELEFRGLKCVGKKLHAVLYENASREWRADMLQR